MPSRSHLSLGKERSLLLSRKQKRIACLRLQICREAAARVSIDM